MQLAARAAPARTAGEPVQLRIPSVDVLVEAVAFVDPAGRLRLVAGQKVPGLGARRTAPGREAHELARLEVVEADEAARRAVEIAERVRARPDPLAHQASLTVGSVDRDALVVAVAVDHEHGRFGEVRGLERDRRVREVVSDEAHLGHVVHRASPPEVALEPRRRAVEAPLEAEEPAGERDIPADRDEVDVAEARAGLREAVGDGEQRPAAFGVLGAAEAFLLAEREQRAVMIDEARGWIVPASRGSIDAEDHRIEVMVWQGPRTARRRACRSGPYYRAIVAPREAYGLRRSRSV